MRILMLAHRVPYPPRTGDKVRAYHIACHLARRHALTLGCLTDEPDAEAAIAGLRGEITDLEVARIPRRAKRIRALMELARGGSATMAYFASRQLRRRILSRHREAPFDLVYVSSSSMAQYVDGLGPVPLVLDLVDIDSDKWLQYGRRLPRHTAWLYRLEARRLRSEELAAARRAGCCLVVTRQEAALLQSFAPGIPTTVIPNGVDLDYFAPPANSAARAVVVFTGAMDYFPNVDGVMYFCHEIWPKVRRAVPEARFVIVGKNPTAAVRRLRAICGVEVTGAVADVRPYMQGAAVAVAPLRVARGVQNKALEAMAMALPVVATSRAHEGLEARAGRHLLVEDSPAGFADAVVKLLRSPADRQKIGGAGRRFVETEHSWATSMQKLDRVLDAVLRGREVPLRPGHGLAVCLPPAVLGGSR